MSKNNREDKNSDKINHGLEAYKTLQEWVRSAPSTMKKIEESGDREEIMRYKKQVKMVLEKLKDIKNEIDNQ
tara:strand:+ start:561 stop:776 length:216 start_codon:yes stop_codon:yes gene_type:complete